MLFCDALILDEDSRSDTYPVIEVGENDVSIEHEAHVSKIGEEQLFYLMSRGLSEEAASTMIVNGFIDPLIKEPSDGVRSRDESVNPTSDGRVSRLKRGKVAL